MDIRDPPVDGSATGLAVSAEASDIGRRQPSFTFLMSVLLAGQSIGTMGTTMIPAVAPKVAQTYGISSALVGYQISMLACAMIVSLAFGSKFNSRWGSTRMQQIGLSLVAIGGLIAILPHVVFFFLASIALGLGYGSLTPSASNLLLRFTPADKRNLIFSIKQTGVPLGGIGAALITPAVAVHFGWQWAIAGNSLALFILVWVMGRARPHWDTDRNPQAPIGGNPFSGVIAVWRHPALRGLSICGGCFVVVQFGISTFTVILFNEELGWDLICADGGTGRRRRRAHFLGLDGGSPGQCLCGDGDPRCGDGGFIAAVHRTDTAMADGRCLCIVFCDGFHCQRLEWRLPR